jgi:hypothetical protein
LLQKKKLNDIADGLGTRLLVVVPILMPSPRCETKTDDEDSNVEERLVYSVGIVNVPWHKMEEG